MAMHNTGENVVDISLQTHWYRDTYEIVKNAILRAAEELKMEVISVNDEYKELYAINANYRITLKVTSYHVSENSVDLYVETQSLMALFGWRKMIASWYSLLDRKLNCIGTSLHR